MVANDPHILSLLDDSQFLPYLTYNLQHQTCLITLSLKHALHLLSQHHALYFPSNAGAIYSSGSFTSSSFQSVGLLLTFSLLHPLGNLIHLYSQDSQISISKPNLSPILKSNCPLSIPA